MADTSMEIPKPSFKPEINLGHILQLLVIGGSLAGYLYTKAGADSEIRRDVRASADARATYVPIIQQAQKANEIQDMRIGNLADAVQDIRKTNSEVLIALGNIRESMARIETRVYLQYGAPPPNQEIDRQLRQRSN